MEFTKENALMIWGPYSFNEKKWPFCSIPILYKKMIEDFVKYGTHMIIPLPESHAELKENFYPKSDLIEFVPMKTSYLNGCLQIHDCKEIQKITNYKMVFNLEPASTKQVLAMFSKPAAYFTPLLVNYILFSTEEDLLSEYQRNDVVVNIMSHHAIFNGPASMKAANKSAVAFMSPSFLRAASRNHAAISLGINCAKIDALRKPRTASGKMRFLYGGRLTSHKQIERTIEMVNTLHKSGLDVEYKIQTYGRNSSEKLKAWAEKYPFIKPYYDQPIEVFYENMFDTDFFICASKIETYGLSFFEMMYAGVKGIFLQKDWQKGILKSDYPFQCIDDDKIFQVIKSIASTDSGKTWASNCVESVQNWIRTNEDSSKKNLELLEKLKSWLPEVK